MSRRQSGQCEIDMTPMIDVVFQLIIFFIVTIKFTQDYNEDIVLENGPHAPVIEIKGQSATMIIEVDKRGWISINNAQCTPAALRSIVKRRYDRMGEFPIMIRGDYRTQHKDVRTVMDICSEIGIWKISFVAMKEPKTSKRRN